MTLFGRTYPSEAEAERAYRRRWILVPGVVVLLCVVVGMVTALGPWRTRESTISQVYPAGITKVALENPGDVSVVGTSGKQALASWDTQWNYQRPAVRSTRDGDTLRLRLDCSASVGVECSADLRLAVPAGVALDITSNSGDVQVDGVNAPVKVDSRSGEVRATEISGDVQVYSASGDVRLDDISGDVTSDIKSGELHADGLRSRVARITSASGDVKAGFAVMPRHVSVDVKSGEARVEVPRGTGPYQVRPVVRSGDLKIDVSTAPSASSVIDVGSMSGDVKVTYGDGDEHAHRHDHGDRPEPPDPPNPPARPARPN